MTPLRPRFPVPVSSVIQHSSTTATGESKLHSTVIPHKSYIFLHSRQRPTEAPSRIESPLRATLQRRVSIWGGIVNFAWAPRQPVWDDSGQDEVYPATAFSQANGRLTIPQVSMANIHSVAAQLDEHANSKATFLTDAQSQQDVYLYVCTHQAQDCRCGEWGIKVVEALREEVERRKSVNADDACQRIRIIGETTHVGGHKYAANLLVYPYGDWLGNVRPAHVPSVLDAILARSFRPSVEHQEPPLYPALWRGRMGLSSDEQVQLYTNHSQ